MELKLEFNMDNAAFDDCEPAEVARVLREVAARIVLGSRDGKIHDINGNRIGQYVIEETPHHEVARPNIESRQALMAMARAKGGPTIAYIDVETGVITNTRSPLQRGEWIEHEPPNAYEVGVPRDAFFSYKALDAIISTAREMAQERVDLEQEAGT